VVNVDIHMMSENVSVSGQIVPEQIADIAASGVEVLVCNRPDFEEAGQPTFEEIEAAAQAQGLDIANIPFAGGQMTMEHVEAFAEILKTGKRVHAYCRTGNRCSHLWAASSKIV
jgi:uncharacterized protein (TIGR01244 family)